MLAHFDNTGTTFPHLQVGHIYTKVTKRKDVEPISIHHNKTAYPRHYFRIHLVIYNTCVQPSPSRILRNNIKEGASMGAPRNVIEAAKRAVLERYPEMAGMSCSGEPAPAAGKYIVTARRDVHTADGHSLPRIIRVTVDDGGRVLRVSASK